MKKLSLILVVLTIFSCSKKDETSKTPTTPVKPVIDNPVVPVPSTVLWDGSAINGITIFKQIQFQDAAGSYGSTNGSSVTAVTDASEGLVWKFHKDDLDRRCEALSGKGFTPLIGQSYYIGFRFKLPQTPTAGQLGEVFTMMQWKTAGTPNTQNYPFLLVYNKGRIKLEAYPDINAGEKLLLEQKVVANQWYSVVLKVQVSDTPAGSIQIWWGDSSTPAQLLTGGSSYVGKTFDGTAVDPKWGYYRDTGADGDIYFSRLKIGRSWEDVKPY